MGCRSGAAHFAHPPAALPVNVPGITRLKGSGVVGVSDPLISSGYPHKSLISQVMKQKSFRHVPTDDKSYITSLQEFAHSISTAAALTHFFSRCRLDQHHRWDAGPAGAHFAHHIGHLSPLSPRT